MAYCSLRQSARLQPLLRTYGSWGSEARLSYSYNRLVSDGLWYLPDRLALLEAGGDLSERLARQHDAPGGFPPEVLAAPARVRRCGCRTR